MMYLFISYTALMGGIKRGAIKPQDLDYGLMAFGCTLQWVRENAPEEIVEKVEKAIVEGRATFRALEEGNMSYEKLNALLKRNGFPEIDISSIDGPNRRWYNYPTVYDAVENQGIPVKVYWRN